MFGDDIIVIGEKMFSDLVGGRLPHPIVSQYVVEHATQSAYTMRLTGPARMQGETHHPARLAALFIKLIELRLANLDKIIAIAIRAQQRAIIDVHRIGHRDEAPDFTRSGIG